MAKRSRITDTELKFFYQEEEEMDRQRLLHCERCHAAIKSETFKTSDERPIVEYQRPKNCPICRDPDWDLMDKKHALATESNGLLCQCKHTDCGKQVYIKPSHYLRQQSINNLELKKWMPELIDPDKAKVTRLIGESQPDTDPEEEKVAS